jgi:hypothetical protein
MKKKILLKDREVLEQRLKELSETEYSGKISYGAMCYSPYLGVSNTKDYKCPVCGYKTKQDDHIIWIIKDIRTIVAQIKNAGYDVTLDEQEFCNKCSNKQESSHFLWDDEVTGNKYPELKFKIRYTPDSKYHVAKSNIVSDYKCVLEFFKGNDFYLGYHDMTEPIHYNIKVLQKMLGIGKDIIPPERKKNEK